MLCFMISDMKVQIIGALKDFLLPFFNLLDLLRDDYSGDIVGRG